MGVLVCLALAATGSGTLALSGGTGLYGARGAGIREIEVASALRLRGGGLRGMHGKARNQEEAPVLKISLNRLLVEEPSRYYSPTSAELLLWASGTLP